VGNPEVEETAKSTFSLTLILVLPLMKPVKLLSMMTRPPFICIPRGGIHCLQDEVFKRVELKNGTQDFLLHKLQWKKVTFDQMV